jgi:hypothetical protein
MAPLMCEGLMVSTKHRTGPGVHYSLEAFTLNGAVSTAVCLLGSSEDRSAVQAETGARAT